MGHASYVDPSTPRRTERLLLRPLQEEDREAFVAIHTDPRTNIHTLGGPPAREGIEAMFDSVVAAWSTGLSYWAVDLSGRVIGISGVEKRRVLERDCWNLYFRFTPEHWGQGLATEAAREAVKVAGLLEPAAPVVARTRPDNGSAVRLTERVGLTRRIDLDHDGYIVYAINW